MRTWINIDAIALQSNFELLQAVVRCSGRSVAVTPVVKANAYGHGSVLVAKVLDAAGAAYLAVATVEEATTLRVAGITAKIMVFGGGYAHAVRDLIAQDLTPLVGRIEDLAVISRQIEERNHRNKPRFPIHVEIDSGMSRSGISEASLPDLVCALRKCPAIRLDGIATHFSSADTSFREGNAATAKQLAALLRCAKSLRQQGFFPRYLHAANSAATLGHPASHLDLVRPGLALYGVSPFGFGDDVATIQAASSDLIARVDQLRPVLNWGARVEAVREIAAGQTVGYGAAFVTGRDSTIATIPVGYADGYPIQWNNTPPSVRINAHRYPVVGRVCMDLMMVDVTPSDIGPSRPVRVDDTAWIIGGDGNDKISAVEIARWAGVIPYAILANISDRVPRKLI